MELGYESFGNGAFVRVYGPRGSILLQGDDAAKFLADADTTNEKYTDADLCREYESLMT